MSRTKRFSRIALEGFVIIASILIAFGIDAWWDGKEDRADRAEILHALSADFRFYDMALQDVATGLENLNEANRSLIGSFSSVPEGETLTLSDAQLRSTLEFPTLRIPLGVAVPPGAASPELSGLLRLWEARTRTTVNRLDAASDLVFTQIRPLLGADIELSRLDDQSSDWFILGIEPPEGTTQVSRRRALANAVSARNLLFGAAAREVSDLIALSGQIQELIATDINEN